MKNMVGAICFLLLFTASAQGGGWYSPSTQGTVTVNTTVTNNYTTQVGVDLVKVDATAGAITATLGAAADENARTKTIIKTDSSANVVTVDGDGTETLGGALTYRLTYQYDFISITSDGSNWNIVGDSGSDINVKWFGATGDGSTEDHTAIQNALTVAGTVGGATVVFPPGTYHMAQSASIYNDTSLVGQDATIEVATDWSDVRFGIFVNYTGDSGSPVLVGTEDISITGIDFTSEDKATQTNACAAIFLQGTTPTAIERVYLHDIRAYDILGAPVIIRKADVAYVDGIEISGWTGTAAYFGLDFRGIHTGGLNNFYVHDNSGSTTHAIVCNDWRGQGMLNFTISNGVISTVQGDGITFERNSVAPDDITIVNVQFETITGQAIGEISNKFQISNVLIDTASMGIYSHPTLDVHAQLTNVRIRNTSHANGAIYSTGTGTWSISNVDIYNSEGEGIQLYGMTRANLNQIVINDTVDAGILISATADTRIVNATVIDSWNQAGPSGGSAVSIGGDYFVDDLSITFTGANKPQYGLVAPAIATKQFLGNNYIDACDSFRYRFGTSNQDLPVMQVQNGRRVGYDTAAPTSGTWALGDVIYNTEPSVGEAHKWNCTVAGTPGTWVRQRIEKRRIDNFTGNENITLTDGTVLIRDPNGASRSLVPTGTFPEGELIYIINTADAAEDIIWNTGGADTYYVGQNETAIVSYDGTLWRTLLLGQNDLTQDADVTFNSVALVAGLTAGSATTVGSGTKHDGIVTKDAAEVQTTDATQTAVDSISLSANNTYHVEAYVIGVKSDASQRASYHIACTAYLSGPGLATLQGTVTSLHSQESDANWDATFGVSGTSLGVYVTGVAATTIEWGCTMNYINMSN